jgi:hypothetical protein
MEVKYVNRTDQPHKMYFISDIPQTMDKAQYTNFLRINLTQLNYYFTSGRKLQSVMQIHNLNTNYHPEWKNITWRS